MDLIGVREIRVPSTRAEVAFAPAERPLGGGTWLFSEPQPGLSGLVDLTALGWEPIVRTDAGLEIAATCTIAELAALTPEHSRAPRQGQDAHALFWQCATSLLASFKIWNVATVGGNIALALPAGSMTSLAAALDAVAVIWTTDGGERRSPVAELVTGVRSTGLAHGEVLRAIEIPQSSLDARTGFRRIALSPLGRAGTVVVSRVDQSGEVVVTITAGTTRPHQLRFDELPSERALAEAVTAIDDWYSDAHGAPDWRRATSLLFAEQLRVELGGAE
ncbi:MAG TPA: FAD-binding molybdopterin dehydrogenase [Microbacteriaceae bacterium]|jgi:CO/xanthine dehydrogenase FAD-binding subunit|nr:FAD-binding molybdopterin dehydrogenase [Microbacteriaceae bacterium]